MRFDIGGHVGFAVIDSDEAVLRRVRGLMDPYASGDAGEASPDVVVEATDDVRTNALLDIQNAAGDTVVTASDGDRLYLLEGGRRCVVPTFDRDGLARIRYEAGFPVWRIFGSLIRPALQFALLDRGAAALHSASVELDGSGIVVAGWSETGKTETALAFMELGARFVSDKWTIVDAERRLACFPISVGVRRWVLDYLPRLKRSLPRAARAQLLMAGLASSITSPIRRARPRGRMGEVAVEATERAVALADRAALRPSEVSAAYGQALLPTTATASTLALLTTVPDDKVSAREADAAWAARRLARSATYERRPFFDLYRRSRFAFVGSEGTFPEDVERREASFFANVLRDVQILDVHAPFPADPHRVADAILRTR
jgi:hypothetical protein